MTREDIIRMAREAGFILSDNATDEAIERFMGFADLIVFEASVKAAKMLADGLAEARTVEREACAVAAEKQARWIGYNAHAEAIAAAIRARGQA